MRHHRPPPRGRRMPRLRLACKRSCSRFDTPFGRVHHLFNGGDDVDVSAAAADVAAHQLADLVGRVRPPLMDQTNGRTNLPWRAVAALKRVVLEERLLEWMKHAVLSEPFNR